MWKKLFPHIHWHWLKHTAGANSYHECRCGSRKVRKGSWGMSPVDQGWLDGEDWDRPRTIRLPPPPPDRRPL